MAKIINSHLKPKNSFNVRANTFRLAGALISASLSVGVAAQQNERNIHEFSTQPPNGRFEIVQSPLVARWTFRLDRHTGQVDQLVSSFSGGVARSEMPAIGLPKAANASKPRFVLFTSGLVVRDTFLIDTETGDTWILTMFPGEEDGSEGIAGWAPIDE